MDISAFRLKGYQKILKANRKENFMSTTLEKKLSDLIHEIKEIKKEMIFQEITKAHVAKNKLSRWKALRKKVSATWNKVSAVEEISEQREKKW